MVEVASLIVGNLLIATFIGFLIGYFIGKGSSSSSNYTPEVKDDNSDNPVKPKKKEAKSKSSVNPIFRKNSSVDNKPLVLSAPRQSGKDNLIKIKGIDLQIQEDLNSLGIFHFDQISKWSNKNCDWVEEYLQLPNYAKQYQWVEQAKILESGKETIYSQKIENNEIEVS